MSESRPETGHLQPVSPDYAAGLLFAAYIAHAEARWQTELAGRKRLDYESDRHRFAAERATKVEGAIRAVAEAVAR